MREIRLNDKRERERGGGGGRRGKEDNKIQCRPYLEGPHQIKIKIV